MQYLNPVTNHQTRNSGQIALSSAQLSSVNQHAVNNATMTAQHIPPRGLLVVDAEVDGGDIKTRNSGSHEHWHLAHAWGMWMNHNSASHRPVETKH